LQFLFEYDLRANAFRVRREGKPVHTFPDHALDESLIISALCHRAGRDSPDWIRFGFMVSKLENGTRDLQNYRRSWQQTDVDTRDRASEISEAKHSVTNGGEHL
jgi:hypothetical protein